MTLYDVCRKTMLSGLLVAFLIVGSLAGCASDRTVLTPDGGAGQVAEDTDDASPRKTKRKKLSLDDGKRGKQSPVLKNSEMRSPPSGPPPSMSD